MEIVTWPNPILEQVAKRVEVFDDDLRRLVAEMFKVMHDGNGIGLAAPQIGISKRIFIMDVPGQIKRVIINPYIVDNEGDIQVKEGCLSFPGLEVQTSRSSRIEASYFDENGHEILESFLGLSAICFQHENDHLNGKTFLRFMSEFKRKMMKL